MTLQAVFMAALLLTMIAGISERMRSRVRFGGAPRRICSALLPLLVVYGQMKQCDAAPKQRSRPPMPTDLELWAAGQLSRSEQLAAALQRHILDTHLHHNSAEAAPPIFTVVPPDLVGEAVLPTFEDRALHVTLWVAAVFYEAETVDIEMPLPLSSTTIKEALRGATSNIPASFDEYHPTVPQLGDYFGSFVAQPIWLRNTNRRTLIMDARAVGGTAYAFYQEGRVNLAAATRQLPEFNEGEVDFYVFGRLAPLVQGQSYEPPVGGVIKAVPRGRQCHWSDLLENRLPHPLRWSPHVDPPGQVDGLHTVLQSATDQVIDEIGEADERPLEVVAEEALDLEHGDSLVFLPNERMQHLAHAGRTIYEQVAVVHSGNIDPAGPCVVFVDLRPLTLFPQWLQMTSDTFDPRAYISDLQIQGSEDWVIVVEGGEPQRGGRLRVQHRETLTFSLQPPGTSSEEETDSDGGDDDEDGGDGQEDSSSGLSIFHSSDMSTRSPSPGGAPRGPPPPQPCDRSRSPRRERQDTAAYGLQIEHNGVQLQLADKLPAPVYDMDQECVHLPHSCHDVGCIGRVWPPDWMQLDICSFDLKQATMNAVADLAPWTGLLLAANGINALVAHLYTDGSFDPGKQNSGAAMLVVLEQQGQQAIIGGCGTPILGDAATLWQAPFPPALYAEQVALVIALLWIWQAMSFLPLKAAVIHFDCQAAGWSADGTWGPCNAFAKQIHDLERSVRCLLQDRLTFQHVKAHSGQAWNECVDILAKAAARQDERLPRPPVENCAAFLRADLRWLAASWWYDGNGPLPIQHGQWMQWGMNQQTEGRQLAPAELVPTVATLSSKAHGTLHAAAVSLNIQGLKGKHAYLEAQLAWKETQIAFLQETKDADGTVRTKRFLRLASPSEAHWGTALWLSREHGAFDIDGTPVFVDEADVAIVANEPRLLLATIKKAGLCIVLLSGHVPHSARAAEREAYLGHLRKLLAALPTADLVIGGIDANARPPLSFGRVTGTRACGDVDHAGQVFATFLNEQGLWLPSTFDEYHEGTDVTYQHPCGQEHRIDFFAIGGEAAVVHVGTRVALDIDTANKLEDHKAIELNISVSLSEGQENRRLYRPRFDRQKMRTVEGKKVIQQAMIAYEPPGWITTIDRHCQHLQEYILKVMEDNFKVPQGGPRASYISEEVLWEWRAAKLRLKQNAGHRRRMWHDAVVVAFNWWAGQDASWHPKALNKQALLYQLVAASISFTTDRIKKQIGIDKATFLRQCAYDGGSNIGQILHKLKQNGVGGRKNKLVRRPLPRLESQDGCAATCREQRDEIWLRHFGAQEYGCILSTKNFLNSANQVQIPDAGVNWSIEDIPSVLDVEQVLRATPLGKSPGLDNLPGEFLRAAPAAMAGAVHPLFTKALVNLRQPLQWRGGILFEAWKGVGSIADPNSHRSLFVSSALGKAYHKLMRNRGQDALQTALHDLHLGSRRGAPINFASLYLIGFLRGGCRLGRSFAALFIDTRSAYYRVVRQVAVGQLETDENVAKLLAHFGLEPEDMHQMLALVQAGGLMTEAGNPPSVRAACADFHRTTWFVSSYANGDRLATTQTGSRPGESWADAIFAYVYARAMGTLIERADGESILSFLGSNVEAGVSPAVDNGLVSIARDGTWADDSVLPVEDQCPVQLVSKVKRLCSLAVSTLEEFGLSPNLKAGKTSVLLHLVGKGATKARKLATRRGRPVLYLEDLALEIPVVPQYVHLGGIVDAKLTGKPEARKRLALIGSAFDQGRRLLFQNPTIPLAIRTQLFEVSVRSSLFNLANWVPGGDAWNCLVGGYSRCLRRLLVPFVQGVTLFRLPLPAVHVLTNSWSIELVAVRSRLGVLSALARNGPDVLWAVLQREQTWLQCVRQDMQMLRDFDSSWPAVEPPLWQHWTQRIKESPGAFKAVVKRMLQARHKRDMESQSVAVALWMMYRQTGQHNRSETAGDGCWTCRMCCRSFRSKGGLGAHMFKTHGRKAAYRACVQGSVCRACGTQFWSEARLSVHLRDTPRCSALLRSKGMIVSETRPGHGSKEWRRLEVEQFTPAPTEQQFEPLCETTTVPWSDEAQAAYKAVCSALLDQAQWEATKDAAETVVAVFRKAPLFAAEDQDICDCVLSDIRDLQLADSLPWDADSTLVVENALKQAAIRPDYRPADDEDSGLSLLEFAKSVANIDWRDVVSDCCETPDLASETLCIGWDVEKPVCREVRDVPTAISDPLLFVPDELRTAWGKVLLGQIKAVKAPQSFWDHPLSAPFRSLRDVCT